MVSGFPRGLSGFPRGYGSLPAPPAPKRPRRWPKGELHPRAKLTWKIVRAIRADAAEGCKLRQIAWWRGVNPGTVFKIINHQQWIE
jgi:hypothetical protein